MISVLDDPDLTGQPLFPGNILGALLALGALTTAELARATGLTESAVWSRCARRWPEVRASGKRGRSRVWRAA